MRVLLGYVFLMYVQFLLLECNKEEFVSKYKG
jgi:hypothetical protein